MHCSLWEGFAETTRDIAQWKRWFTENADLITLVRTTADIRRAKEEEKTGIILGLQNTSAFEDRIGYIALLRTSESGSCKSPTTPRTWLVPAVMSAVIPGSAVL